MGAIEHLTIAVPAELADRLRDRVATGEFASLDDVVREALHDFEAEQDTADDPAIIAWFHREVVPAIERYDADPSSGLTVEQVRERLAQARWAREQPSC